MAAGEPRRLRLGVAVLQLCLRVVQLLLFGNLLHAVLKLRGGSIQLLFAVLNLGGGGVLVGYVWCLPCSFALCDERCYLFLGKKHPAPGTCR